MLTSIVTRRVLISTPTTTTRLPTILLTRTYAQSPYRPNPTSTSSTNTINETSARSQDQTPTSSSSHDQNLGSEPFHDANGASGHAAEWAGMAKTAAENVGNGVEDAAKGLKGKLSSAWESVVGKDSGARGVKEIVRSASESVESATERQNSGGRNGIGKKGTDATDQLQRTTTKREGVIRDRAHW
ncbi:hypothetical protein HK097_000447 [Rhizophlyctis rosea]|uniref:Uncharacterized protein n=1 Tax=Rhizophlyctis rosea TaxID=64517 RepID=A0AAD5S5F8_9FUNG|nr:hypothetical protein HK097_000447 [Rhizophlyctis rosea]